MAIYDTALQVVSDASVELGLGSVSAVYAATAQNIVLLRTLLKAVGRQLIKDNQWLQATLEHTFTSNGSSSYNLPAGFSRMVDGTGWNRTQKLPIRPVSPKEWQALKAQEVEITTAVLFRPRDATFSVWPLTNTGDSFAFEYASNFWVRATASSAPDKNAPTVDTDAIHIESLVVVKALKLAWLRAKGFDTVAAEAEADAALKAAEAENANSAPTLDYTGASDRELGEPSITANTTTVVGGLF